MKQIVYEQNRSLTSPKEIEGAFKTYFEKLFTTTQPGIIDIGNCLKNLEPISLYNVICKITSKVLANRLKKMIIYIISPNQSAFIPGRLITDIMVVYEVLNSMKARNKGNMRSMTIKLDMSKVYNKIE